MPLNETPTEPGLPPSEAASEPHPSDAVSPQPASPQPNEPVLVRAGRYGEMEAHELIHLLDSIDTERERARFRESIYISVFIWILVAWVVFYGPRYLWHQPKLKSPVDVMRERELTQLTMPRLPSTAPAIKAAPAPKPALDSKTLDKLRAMAKQPAPAPAAKPLPETPQPVAQPATPPPPTPAVPTPQPRTPPPIVADAPTPQPTRPNFGAPSSAGDAMRSAVDGATRGRTTGSSGPRSYGARSSPLNLGGAEILSDTQGVDFNPYLRRVLGDIYRNWLPLIPEEVRPPLSKEGQSFIRFSILPDGSIGEMHLDGSTHDEAINRSCWGSITAEGQFPPLPSQFHGPKLELRIHYIVSQNRAE